MIFFLSSVTENPRRTQWLKPGTGEAKRQKDESKCLVDWVEHGVTDAIERGYLRSIYFGIAADPEGKEILEQYVFTLGASVDGGERTVRVTRPAAVDAEPRATRLPPFPAPQEGSDWQRVG